MDRKKILKGVYSDVWKEAGTQSRHCVYIDQAFEKTHYTVDWGIFAGKIFRL